MLNVKALSKAEINRRIKFRCSHGHNGLDHPRCYDHANGLIEKVGFVDIEASNLNATFGICYTYCIKELDGDIIARAINLEDLYSGRYDKPLLSQFIEDIKPFTRLVLHYGIDRKFDLPFLRTRAVKWKLPFPEYKFHYVSDTQVILRNKFKLHSNRLETACDFFDIPSKKHKLKPDVWLKMVTGNPVYMKDALDYILTHNKEDVISLEKLWKKISKYTKMGKTSL